MGFLNNLLHGPAVLAMKNAEPETPTIMDSMPEAISWPTDAEFAGYANGMYCREYAVRVVVDFISRQLASLPLKVYRKNADGDAEEVRDGALAKLIRHPSDLPGMSRYRFYATLIRDMLLEDRWLCTLGSNRAGDGNTLRRIPPDGYSLTANGFGELTGVTISSVAENKGGTYRLPDPRIVLDIGYIDGLNLGDPITDVLRPLLAEARVMAKYRKSIAENGYQVTRPRDPANVGAARKCPGSHRPTTTISPKACATTLQAAAWPAHGRYSKTAWRSAPSTTCSNRWTWPTWRHAKKSTNRCASHSKSAQKTSASAPAPTATSPHTRKSCGTWNCCRIWWRSRRR